MKGTRTVVKDPTEVMAIFRAKTEQTLRCFGYDECEIVDSSRMTWSWAIAYGWQWKITVNSRGLSRSGMTRAQLTDLVKHEAAHLITWGRYRRNGHGEHFKYVCTELDCSPSATRTKDTPIGYQGWLNARRRKKM